jgi:DNA-binding beta-propeller fold protein YncE
MKTLCTIAFSAYVASLALLAGGCSSAPEGGKDAPAPSLAGAPKPQDLRGSFIAVLCDADLPALNGESAPGNAKDALTVIPLPFPAPQANVRYTFPVTQLPVSNSVLGPGTAMCVSPDGKTLYVVETRKALPEGSRDVESLPAGDSLFAIDVSSALSPKLMSTLKLGRNPTSVALNASGSHLLVLNALAGEQIVIVPVKGNALGEANAFALAGIEDRQAEASSAAWHPSGRYFAVTLPKRNAVALFEFTPTGNAGKIGIARWGKAITTGATPTVCTFTPDGRHLVVSELRRSPTPKGFLGLPERGGVSVIELSTIASELPTPGSSEVKAVEHKVVSTLDVGFSPESMALSPDGKFVAVANVRRSPSAGTSTPGASGSVSLMRLNGGRLVPAGEFDLRGSPRGIAFDASGRNLVVAQYRSSDPSAVDSELAFFRLVDGDTPKLIPAEWYAGVGIGSHSVIVK